MEDLGTFSDEIRGRRWKKWFIAALVLYFIALTIYAIHIAQQKTPFFTRVSGQTTYAPGDLLNLRIVVIGTTEMRPLSRFGVRLELVQPSADRAWTLFEGYSGDRDYVNILGVLPRDLPPGDYLARLTTEVAEYGQEQNEFNLALRPTSPPRAIDVQVLDPRFLRRTDVIEANDLTPPVELRLIANSGRFVPNVNNAFLAVAETLPDHLPADGLAVTIKSGGKTIATLETDAMGLARFDHYPHRMGAEQLDIELTDSKGGVHSQKVKLGPIGAQVLARPEAFFIPANQNPRFRLETLRPGAWHIDVFQHGRWLTSLRQNMLGAPMLVDLTLPVGTQGLVQVQVASDVVNPVTAFDTFYLYLYDPATAVLNPEDPRLKNSDPDDPKRQDLALEAPFKKLWSLLNADRSLSRPTVETWQKKINALSLANKSYDPTALAEQILRELPKDYLILPELFDTRDNRTRGFAKQQKDHRNSVILLLALSGVVVMLALIIRIGREIYARREEEVGIELSGNTVTIMVAYLAVVIAAYAVMLYFLSILDWYKGI